MQPPAPVTDRLPADPEPRFLAYLVDRGLAWGVAVAVALLVGRHAADHVRVALLTFVVVLLLLGALTAVGMGRFGITPGMAAFGLRVVRRDDGRPVGVRPALLRTAVLGLAGLPTLGLGLVALAWTALSDPTGERRGAHDRIGDAMVVEARGAAAEPEGTEEEPAEMVNLTTLRLLPDPAPQPLIPADDTGDPTRSRRPPVRWLVSLDTGEEAAIEGPMVFGGARLGVAPDGALVVMDPAVTPETTVVRGGHPRPLSSARATTLLAGDEVRFGDRSLRVLRRETS